MIKKILLIALFSTSLSVSAKVPKYAYITDTVDVALRSDRSFNNNIIRALTTGDKVKIVRHFDGWTQIHYGGETGWMMSRYLKNKPGNQFLMKESLLRTQKLIAEKQFWKNKSIKLRKQLLQIEKDFLIKEIKAEEDKERELAQEDILNEMKVKYVNKIASKVKAQWRYKGAKDNWGCDVYILQDADGEVQSVSVQSCNVPYLAKKKAFKDAIERAVYKASPLPKPPTESVFDSEILLHFKVN
jgi:hypothetical protein